MRESSQRVTLPDLGWMGTPSAIYGHGPLSGYLQSTRLACLGSEGKSILFVIKLIIIDKCI